MFERSTPPVDKAYTEALRKRYGKAPRDIGYGEPFDLAREAKPDLLKLFQRFFCLGHL